MFIKSIAGKWGLGKLQQQQKKSFDEKEMRNNKQ
jgi:hypothetical protein